MPRIGDWRTVETESFEAGYAAGLKEGERERERLHRWLSAIAPMCQWLDFHVADVVEWGESATEAHEAMHEAVAAYESAYPAQEIEEGNT